MADSTMTYDKAANLRKNAFTRTGYSFESWSDGNGNFYADQASVKNLATSGTKTLWVKWKANDYTIKYDANSGTGSMADSTMTYDKATNLRKNAFTRTGYSFESWSDGNGNFYADQASVKNLATSGTKTLWAKWKPNTYKVTLDDSSGKITTINVTYDAKYVNLTTPQKDGYTFSGWFTEKNGKGTLITKNTTVKITSAQTLYAHLEKIDVKGDINSDGKFNVADVVLLQKWILAVPDVKLADWKAADLCEDGRLDVFDLCMMKRMLVENS